ncbi:MAG TPA: RluA family pseudouridine synthase [Candidatus Saccharimonadales bacterium]|jgi:23S rRNA pseudouridine1911/1915/1917 synthase|nr:RluA family pseudouridine synthase [Candidatus Saccharimonadales bacterium]
MRLDVYLAQYWPDYSRSTWQKYCKQGRVKVNGEVVTSTKYELGEDDEVTVETPAATDFTGQTLPIIYEDDDVVVVNKPAGILTHAKGVKSDEFSVAEFMRSRTTDGADGNRPGIVHRLDRDTSGVIICAKTPDAKHFLQKQFQDRKAKKTYLALVRHIPKEPSAIIKLPIERNPKRPQTFRVGAGGKYAETAYEVIETYPDAALVQLKPLTGRTHQLRVHLAYVGCPIVGDKLYGTDDFGQTRLMLHAQSLEITVPSRERKTFTAEPPTEFTDVIDKLKI